MAGVLSTPRVSASASFYLRKLRTYMYGIFSGQANRHSLAFWDETMVTLPLAPLHRPTPNWTGEEGMQRGSHLHPPFPCPTKHREHTSELVTAYTDAHTATTIDTHARWGDNTTAQMHNSHVMLYNNECVREDGFSYFRRIDNKYSPPGHTFMEVRNSLSVRHLATVVAMPCCHECYPTRSLTEPSGVFRARPRRPWLWAPAKRGCDWPKNPKRLTTITPCGWTAGSSVIGRHG